MVRKNILNDVANAIVWIIKKGGQGVLVNNNLILTAAHCVDYSCEGTMVLGEHFIEEIKTNTRKFKVAPFSVEPVNDIAVLGSLDEQVFFEETDEFRDFCEHTKPVPVCRSEFEPNRKFRIHIYTHKGTWVKGTATQGGKYAKNLYIEADEQIEPGTSGGPIINDSGELVGIVSFVGDAADEQIGLSAPCPHLTLPVWVCRQIFGPEV